MVGAQGKLKKLAMEYKSVGSNGKAKTEEAPGNKYVYDYVLSPLC